MKKVENDYLSIIIPTLNEADYIGHLLYSLSRQTFKKFEVILSDGHSNDDTIKVAKSFSKHLPRFTIVTSVRKCPSVQRNNGVKKAQYKRILFLDADTILPPDFLEKSLNEIEKRQLDCAHPTTFPLTKRLYDQYLYMLTNWGVTLTQKFFPLAGGWAIFSTQTLHKKIKGFDEGLTKIYDDVDYVARIVKASGKFGIITESSPYISVRRLDKEGRAGLLKNMLTQSLYMGLFGKYKLQTHIDRPFGEFGNLATFLTKERKTDVLLKKLTSAQFERFMNASKKLWKELISSNL